MEVNCEGCAGCCMDWRPLLEREDGATAAARDADAESGGDGEADHRRQRSRDPFTEGGDEQGSSRKPLDDDANFVPLTRDEVRAFLDAGMADALTPRFWYARDARGERSDGANEEEGPASGAPRGNGADDEGVDIDGHTVAAVAGRPVFFVGLRKPPKPVAPFGREEPTWLPICVFLDPATLQCRIHGSDRYPDECGAYPERNLALEQATECERVEAAFGGDRLCGADHDDPDGLLLGSQAIGAKLFCHPRPADLEGIVERAASGDLTQADRAEVIAVAAASSPGTLATSDHHYERAKARVLEDEGGDDESTASEERSWVGPAIRDWNRRYRAAGETVPSPAVADAVETARGAPETPGWDALE
ncbi:YkgJ family cysteine cluster protein [Natrinema versiforme]|uniref:YkgJ family cysteine cluster protein n=1 Tax=Natrinema versiforme TaxID=88724 RepID=A0A4P8WNX6_9EURY|nr:YkgJ family cysteine cluster protein [Natrinema versiforme]QCS44153.1 YkgJ family cysteine cluster protein [Natrinema versiforme]